MLRSAVIGTLVACLVGFAVLDAQLGEVGYSEAFVTGESAGTRTDTAILPAEPADATPSTGATASEPQEPAASQDSWAENRPRAGTSRSLPARLFPADNWWNLRISDAPLDPKSAHYIAGLATVHLSYDWGNNYGSPFTTVSGNHPKVRFSSAAYWNETDHDIGYPIPAAALTEPGWTQDLLGTIANPISAGDRHMLIVDVDNQYLYEIYQPFFNDGAVPKEIPFYPGHFINPGEYWCASAAAWDMKTNKTRPDGWTSGAAAGTQILPGAVQYDEVTGSEPISHALLVTLNGSAKTAPYYVWPATHYAPGAAWSAVHPPLGARFRLKSSKDLSGYRPRARKLLQALKDYGLIFTDNGTNGMLGGTNDERWGAFDSDIRMELSIALSGLTFADFEVIELGWRPTTDPAAATISWPTPAPIVQGKPLGPDELAATSSVPGSFVYDPPAGSVLPPGVHMLTATFIPASSALAADAPMPGAASPEGEEPPAVHGPIVHQVDEMEPTAGAEPCARTATTETVVSVRLVVLTQPRTTPAIDWPAPAPIGTGHGAQLVPTQCQHGRAGHLRVRASRGNRAPGRHTHAVGGVHARRHHALQRYNRIHDVDRHPRAPPVDGGPSKRRDDQRRRDQLRNVKGGMPGDNARRHVARTARDT